MLSDSEDNNNKKYIRGANLLLSTESKRDSWASKGSISPWAICSLSPSTPRWRSWRCPGRWPSPRSKWRWPSSAIVPEKQYLGKKLQIAVRVASASKRKLLWTRGLVLPRVTAELESWLWEASSKKSALCVPSLCVLALLVGNVLVLQWGAYTDNAFPSAPTTSPSSTPSSTCACPLTRGINRKESSAVSNRSRSRLKIHSILE